MAKGTRAVGVLEKSGVAFTLYEYGDVGDGPSYGEAVAGALGTDPDRLFKTLVVIVDGAPAVGIIPVSGHLSLKRFAKAVGGKHASMADPADAQRLTGYVVGGISPFGQRRRLVTCLDETAMLFETIFVSAGLRGLQVEIAPDDLVTLSGAVTADIVV